MPKPDGGFYGVTGLTVGLEIDLYSRVLMITDADGFTRAFMEKIGAPLGDALATPSQVHAVAARVGVSESRLLLRYALQKGWAVLPKSVSAARIRENIDLVGFSIPDEEMAALDAMERESYEARLQRTVLPSHDEQNQILRLFAAGGAEKGTLRLLLRRGSGLKAGDSDGSSDPYVVVGLGKAKRRRI